MSTLNHIQNFQPPETKGKFVSYKNVDVFDDKNNLIEKGRWHAPVFADALNWLLRGKGCPSIGIISQYRIVN